MAICFRSAVNLAYTTEELLPHMDLTYYESPPGIQFLHALRFDDGVKGGDSTFVDSFQAVCADPCWCGQCAYPTRWLGT